MNGKERGYLIRACTDYTLQVTPRLLTLPPEKQDKILKHEAIHMGYGNHDSKFMELADIVGASYTESSLDSKVRIQEKIGGRYRTIQEADTVSEAQRLGREYAKLNPTKKYRIEF